MSRSHEALLSTSCALCTLYLQSLKLLRLMVTKIHYLTLKVKVTQGHSRHHVTYAPAKFDVATAHGLGEDAFTRKYII